MPACPGTVSLFASPHEYSKKWTGSLVTCKDIQDTEHTADIIEPSVNNHLRDWIHQGEPRNLYPDLIAH
jgi:hypothetical protein